MEHSHSESPEVSALARTVANQRRDDLKHLLATLRADYDPEVRGEFKTVIQGSLAYGISPVNLADAFAVSTATISRWGRGRVVPGLFIRRAALDRIEDMLKEDSLSAH